MNSKTIALHKQDKFASIEMQNSDQAHKTKMINIQQQIHIKFN